MPAVFDTTLFTTMPRPFDDQDHEQSHCLFRVKKHRCMSRDCRHDKRQPLNVEAENADAGKRRKV
jgi:hypothetical protein